MSFHRFLSSDIPLPNGSHCLLLPFICPTVSWHVGCYARCMPSKVNTARRAARSRKLGRWSCLGAVSGLLFAGHALSQASTQGAGLHGALSMSSQVERSKLLVQPGARVDKPEGIAPEVWAQAAATGTTTAPGEVELGRALYFDVRLSRDGSVACATCHDVSRGFTDRRATSEGLGTGRRNAPTTLNAALLQSQFWDGRVARLEDQARLPITNPIEMGMKDESTAVAAIARVASYQTAFRSVYGREPNMDDVARALAAFERTLVFLDAPFDRFLRGDENAITPEARAGFALFNGKARCNSCHQMSSSNPLGTDHRFHNIGVSARHQDFATLAQKSIVELEKNDSKETLDRLALETDLSELGRFVVTRNRSDVGAFKTSQLRNIGITSPYMHDGSLQTLWDVVDHYNKGGEANPFLDGGIEPLALTEQEVGQVVSFLFTLTDVHFSADNDTERTRQAKLAASQRPFRDAERAERRKLQFEKVAPKAR
jgi:cytochrome c peroxidase